MSGLDQAVRAALIAHLRSDRALTALVPRIEDGQPADLRVPAVVVGEQQASDWGTKDRDGRELIVTLLVYGRQQGGASIGAALAALEAALRRFTVTDGVCRLLRTRIVGDNQTAKGPGWQAEAQLRVRALG